MDGTQLNTMPILSLAGSGLPSLGVLLLPQAAPPPAQEVAAALQKRSDAPSVISPPISSTSGPAGSCGRNRLNVGWCR